MRQRATFSPEPTRIRHALAAADEFRFENRLPSTAAAVRELMRRGLLPAAGDDAKPL